MWNGRIGWPVAPASQTAPGCATRAGPRGPSTVKAAGAAGGQLAAQLHERARAAARRRSARRAETRTASMIRAIHSPSKFSAGDDDDAAVAEVVESRRRIRPCQSARIGWRPDAHQLVVVLGALDPPAQRARRARAISGYAAAAISGGLQRGRVDGQGQPARPLHALVLRPAAAFRRHPVDDLVRDP